MTRLQVDYSYENMPSSIIYRKTYLQNILKDKGLLLVQFKRNKNN